MKGTYKNIGKNIPNILFKEVSQYIIIHLWFLSIKTHKSMLILINVFINKIYTKMFSLIKLLKNIFYHI